MTYIRLTQFCTFFIFFFFNDTATTEIYPLSLHDALPISRVACGDPAELAAETAADGGRCRRQQRLYAVRDRGVRRQRGIEDEGAVVLGAVAVDVGPDDRRERGSRHDVAEIGRAHV